MRTLLLNRKVRNVNTTNNAKKVVDKIYGLTSCINLVSIFLLGISSFFIVNEVRKDKDVFLFTNDGRVIEHKISEK